MKQPDTDNPYADKGARRVPEIAEARILMQGASCEGGSVEMPSPARKYALRFSLAVTHYPAHRELPKWLRALVQRKVSAEEVAKTLHDRISRAPTEENQELGLLVANEIARMKGGTQALNKHATPKLFASLSRKGVNKK